MRTRASSLSTNPHVSFIIIHSYVSAVIEEYVILSSEKRECADILRTGTNIQKAASENLKFCATLPRRSVHLPCVNSASVSGASLDFGVFGACLKRSEPPYSDRGWQPGVRSQGLVDNCNSRFFLNTSYTPNGHKTKLACGLSDAMPRRQNPFPCLAPNILASHPPFYARSEYISGFQAFGHEYKNNKQPH